VAKHLPPADVLRFTLSGTDAGGKWANVFHAYLPGNTLDEVTLAGVLSDIVADANLLALYGSVSGAHGCNKVAGQLSTGTAIIAAETAASFAGTDDATPLPGGVAAVISWQGPWYYRGGKPRTYFGGLTGSALDSAVTLNGTFLASLGGLALAWMTTFNEYTAPSVPVMKLGALIGNTDTAAGTFAPYFGLAVRQQIGSQRRRNRPG